MAKPLAFIALCCLTLAFAGCGKPKAGTPSGLPTAPAKVATSGADAGSPAGTRASVWEQRLDDRLGIVLSTGKDRQIRWLGWSKNSTSLHLATDSQYETATVADEKTKPFGPCEYGILKVFASSPGADFLAQATDTGSKEIEIRNLSDYQVRQKLTVDGDVSAMACSQDATLLAVGLATGKVALFDTKTWQAGGLLEGHTHKIRFLAFSPGGQLASFASDEPAGRVWDIAEMKTIHEPKLDGLDFTSPPPVFVDDNRLAGAGIGKLQILTLGKEEPDVTIKDVSSESQLAASPNGKYLAAMARGGHILLFDTVTGMVLCDVQAVDGDKLGTDTFPLAFSPNGEMIAVGGTMLRWFQVAKLLDEPDTFTLVGDETHSLRVQYPRFAKFARQGPFLVSGNSAGKVSIWNVPAFQEEQSFNPHEDFRSLAISPDDKDIAVLFGRSYLTFFDRERKEVAKEIDSIERGTSGPARIVYLGSGKVVFSTGQAAIELDPATGAVVRELKVEGKKIDYLDVTSDGKWMVTGPQYTSTLDIWDFAAGTVTQSVDAIGDVRDVAFSPDGKQLAVAAFTAGTVVFETQGFKQRHVFDGLQGGASEAVAYSPDSRMLAEARGSALVLRDAASGREIDRLIGHTDQIGSISFSADGKLIATTGQDDSIKIWKAPELK